MSIVRAPRPTGQFTTFRNDVLRDERISFRALGILVEVLSRPDNWRTDSAALAHGRKEGREAVRTALHELRLAGYLVQTAVRGERGRLQTVSVMYDERQPDVDPSTLRPRKRTSPKPRNPSSGQPDSGAPVVGELGALRSTETNNLEEEPCKEERSGIEASFDGLRLASEAASTLPRRGRTKKPTTIRDPKVRDVAADTALAKQIAEEYVYTDENLDVAVDYLWQHGNASTAAGCVRERADRANGEEAMAELFTLSAEWATGLDAAREYAVEYFGSRDIPGPWVGRLADRVRDALAIRTPNQALNAAINAVIDGAYQDPGRVLGAIDEVIRTRESERKAERIDRVRKQQEAKVAA